MDQSRLKETAEVLNILLIKISKTDSEVAKLKLSLQNLIDAALLGRMQEPLDWKAIPGDYLFNESNLRQYADLESAYAKFKIEATGGESAALRAMRARTNARRPVPQNVF